MIEGFEKILEGTGQPGVDELRELLAELLARDGRAVRLIEQSQLQPRGQRVFRLRFALDGAVRSVVIKRLKPEIARRNELVARRWLPAIGLHDCGPPVLGSVAARTGECVWHVYDDLGSHELNPRNPGREQVWAAVELVARMHTHFAGHALLGEVRLHGGDLGIQFYDSNVRDAISALEAWEPPTAQCAVRDRLLERLCKLREETAARVQALAELGGPDTLLHGDLWAINVFVIPTADGLRARLIDWDHAAVGPFTYDLSTFLMRFPAGHREWLLELYEDAVTRAGWCLPEPEALNFLFETHEFARFANRIIWPAIALATDHADWGVAALEEIEQWFEDLEPVLPIETQIRATNLVTA
ncbi:MAG TPA: aminoglycoside phosphotransferase family protein [Verrucomicrobiae bacterium]|jgi:aminoglycoside/choline kinase family phosphotransferase